LVVESVVGESLPSLYADPSRVRQILTNLLSNAVKFTPPGGRVTISATVRGPRSEVRGGPQETGQPFGEFGTSDVGLRTSDAKTFVEIAVTDTGIGIRPEDQPKLFQPFMRLEGSPGAQCEGTGLGLVIIRRLVEMHGGRTWVESEGEGKGSTFTFTLPVAVERDGGETTT
ncbi:MAG: sensor histidine kinase, partial [Candidatus Methylomirabilales bacterium]